MKNAFRRSLPMTPLLICLVLLGLVAALTTGAAAATKRREQLVVVKTSAQARGSVVLHLRAGSALRRDVVRVNGHRVHAVTPYRKGERGVLVLDHADRLHFGRNQITVRARSQGGKEATVHRTVTMKRDAPLAGIREPLRVVAGHVARLDARRTRSAHGGALHFNWRVVRAPRGAKVVLHGAHARRPRLTASVPGNYQVAMTVREDGSGSRKAKPAAARASAVGEPNAGAGTSCAAPGATATTVGKLPTYGPIASLPISRIPHGALEVVHSGASSTPETEPAPSAEPGCTTEVAEVEVEPNFEPIGAAIATRTEAGETEGIRIAGSFYAFPNGEESNGARFVMLDAANLEMVKTENVDLTESHRGVAAKMVAEFAPENDVIVVSACLYRECPGDTQDSSEGWSAIETYARGKRTATVENQGQALTAKAGPEPRGGLEGWLHRGFPTVEEAQPLFSYVAPERIPFDTEAVAPSSTSNTISVGGAEYPATLPSSSSAGFEVLALNAAREPILGTPIAFGTYSNTNQSAAQSQEEAMTALIGASNPSDTVLVQSINDPVPGSNAANKLATAMEKMGVDVWTFLGLKGGGEWAFVGNGAQPKGKPQAETAESSQEAVAAAGGTKGAGGSLHGVLSRDEQSGLYPAIADSVGTPNYEIAQVAYQPRTEWPQTETQGKVEATTWLARKLGLVGGPNGEGLCYRPPQPDFRSIYCDKSLGLEGTEKEVEGTAYPQGETVGFSEAEYTEVKTELVKELLQVGKVRDLFKALKEPFLGRSPDIESLKVAGQVLKSLTTKLEKSGTDANPFTLFGSILSASSFVPGVGDVLGVFSAALFIAGEFSEEEGEPSPPLWQVQIAADEVGAEVERSLQASAEHLGALEDIMVTDPAKLAHAAYAEGNEWAISEYGLGRTKTSIELGIKRWMYEAILPAAFELFEFEGVEPGERGRISCLAHGNSNWQPFKQSAEGSMFLPITGIETGDFETPDVYGMLAGSVAHESSLPVTNELAEAIFGPLGAKGAALTQNELFTDSDWKITKPTMIGNGGESEHINLGECELREK